MAKVTLLGYSGAVQRRLLVLWEAVKPGFHYPS